MEEVYIKVEDLGDIISKLFKNKDLISLSELVGKFEDIYMDLDSLEEEYKDYQQEVEDNYTLKYTSKYDEYGVSEKDFH